MWILGKTLEIYMLQLKDLMKLKKKEGQIVDASVLLRREEREDWERKRRAVSGVRYDGGAGKRSTEGQVVLV